MGGPDNPYPAIAKRTITAWLKTHFEGQTGLDECFTGSRTRQAISNGWIVSVDER